jgi:hypothetical protein
MGVCLVITVRIKLFKGSMMMSHQKQPLPLLLIKLIPATPNSIGGNSLLKALVHLSYIGRFGAKPEYSGLVFYGAAGT